MAEGSTDIAASVLPPQPQLFHIDPIDVSEAWEMELVASFQKLRTAVAGRTQTENHEILQQAASESMARHNELVAGLVYGILLGTPTEGSEYLRQLSIVSRDGFAQAIGRLQLVSSAGRFGRVRGAVRTQLFWLLGELVRMNAHGVEQVALALTRQMRGGDVTPGNIRLCTQLLDFLQTNYTWLMTQPLLIATAAYAFGRVLLDHTRHAELRASEGAFVARLIRERFSECAMVGRDLVRMLQDAARVPEFAEIWRDLLQRPQTLSPQLTSIEQLLRVPTPRVFLANRLTVEMERRLVFILEHVPAAGFTRNLMWFVQRYLSTPEAESLYGDLVRFVVGVVHPPNAVLASNVVPRYVFLGALLRFVRSQVVAANAKLALFYDWLCYDPQRDSIMNIEPGVLLITRSIDRYAYLTASLVEFLSFVVDAYAPALASVIHRSIGTVMLGAVEKGVVPSLAPVCEHPRIVTATRRQLHHLFPQLVPPIPDNVPAGDSGEDEVAGEPGAISEDPLAQLFDDATPLPPPAVNDSSIGNGLGKMSSVEPPPAPPPLPPAVQEQPPRQRQRSLPGLAAVTKPPAAKPMQPSAPVILDPVSRMFHDELYIEEPRSMENDAVDGATAPAANEVGYTDEGTPPEDVELVAEDDAQPLLETPLNDALEDKSLWLFGSSLSNFASHVGSDPPDMESAASALREIVEVFAQSEAPIRSVARILAAMFGDTLDMEDVETNRDLAAAGEPSETLDHDLLHYLFVAGEPYLHADSGDKAKESSSGRRVLQLLKLLTEAKVDVGFRWLLFSCELKRPEHYAQYVGCYAQGTMQAALVRDLHILQERFPNLFYTELPRIYSAFPAEFVGCRGIVRRVISLIDQPQLYRLNMLIARGQLRIFGCRPAAVCMAVSATLECDSFEQVCLWQLLSSEFSADVPMAAELAAHLLLKCELDSTSNSEAATGLLSLLRTVPPSAKLLQVLATYASDEAMQQSLSLDEDESVEPFVRTDLCASVLTSWLRGFKPLLLPLLSDLVNETASTSSVPVGAAQHMVTQWIERFSRRFYVAGDSANTSTAICEEIRAACASHSSPASQPQGGTTTNDAIQSISTADDSEDRQKDANADGQIDAIVDVVGDGDHNSSSSKSQDAGDSTARTNGVKRSSSTSANKNNGGDSQRRTRNSRREVVKRRRRNVDTSDEDDMEDSSEDDIRLRTRSRRLRNGRGAVQSDLSSDLSSLPSSPISSPSP
ncbi:hypothetical protein H4R20_000868 [Coemansia guatemalensis]|uniref:Integrator complex subunit 3 n=1 Tax=Coemansia guatemalensis TaxID=2761395 RepID=A0A9W8LWI5_9FUNG|nr:hypothetical protein H4R20_000868 [Coemansia guatemalensis]